MPEQRRAARGFPGGVVEKRTVYGPAAVAVCRQDRGMEQTFFRIAALFGTFIFVSTGSRYLDEAFSNNCFLFSIF